MTFKFLIAFVVGAATLAVVVYANRGESKYERALNDCVASRYTPGVKVIAYPQTCSEVAEIITRRKVQ